MAKKTSKDAQLYEWLVECASRGLRDGKLEDENELRSLCGAVLELVKRVKVAEERD